MRESDYSLLHALLMIYIYIYVCVNKREITIIVRMYIVSASYNIIVGI